MAEWGAMGGVGDTVSTGKGVMPPILNTGNKGPIEQQPGDWVCGKCDYLVSAGLPLYIVT